MYTCNTVGMGGGMPQNAKMPYHTHSHVTCFGNTTGLPTPILNLKHALPDYTHVVADDFKAIMNVEIKSWWPDKLQATGNLAFSCGKTRDAKVTNEWSVSVELGYGTLVNLFGVCEPKMDLTPQKPINPQ